MRRALLGLLCVTFTVAALFPATPAFAHAEHASEPTNFLSTIKSVEPQIDGLSFEIVAGNQIKATNDTDVELAIFGYQNEPYLRVGPDGIFVNKRSPALYLNQTEDATTPVPEIADSDAEPEWVKQSAGNTVMWHDHRVHWMSDELPPVVDRDPDKRHVVIPDWTVAMSFDERPLTVTGDLAWVPPPSPLPWYALAALAFLIALLPLVVKKRIGLIIVLLSALIAIDVVHVVGGVLAGPTFDIAGTFETALPAAIGWTVGVLGARRLQEGTDDGLWFAVFAALLIALLGGLQPLETLSTSNPVFEFHPAIARAATALSLGGGLGLAVTLVVLIRRQRRALNTESSVIGTEN